MIGSHLLNINEWIWIRIFWLAINIFHASVVQLGKWIFRWRWATHEIKFLIWSWFRAWSADTHRRNLLDILVFISRNEIFSFIFFHILFNLLFKRHFFSIINCLSLEIIFTILGDKIIFITVFPFTFSWITIAPIILRLFRISSWKQYGLDILDPSDAFLRVCC